MRSFGRADRSHSFIAELLHTGAGIGLRRVDVPLRIERHVVNRVELAGIPPAVADMVEHRQRLAEQLPDPVVRAVGDVHQPLLLIL